MAAAVAAGATATLPAGASEVAHSSVVSTDAVDWTPNLVGVTGEPTPKGYSITDAGDRMVVGGTFSMVEDSSRKHQFPRANVFSFMKGTGEIAPDFHPQVDGEVWSVVASGTSVYIGGAFHNIDGTSRPALAKLDLLTGQLDTSFQPPFQGGRVTDMEMLNGHLLVAGTFARRLAALNPATGAMSSYVSNRITGRLPGSSAAGVFRFDVSPDHQHLVAVGNFTQVDGQDRPRVLMLDLGASSTTLSAWNYPPLGIPCTATRKNMIAYVQDVDFSPDSSYFALAAFGYMYQDGQRGKQLCDAVSRFETNTLNPQQPTWINYTGGDSLKSVMVTGPAVYVQGHSRWLDNPYGRDSAGWGAVSRPGGGAVDPATGMALSWNPPMPQSWGGYQMLAVPDGLWFVTDGKVFHGEYHRGLRFAPLPTP